jgi:hypothetical protein
LLKPEEAMLMAARIPESVVVVEGRFSVMKSLALRRFTSSAGLRETG